MPGGRRQGDLRRAGALALMGLAACSLTTSFSGFSSGGPDLDGGAFLETEASVDAALEAGSDAALDVHVDAPTKLVFVSSVAYVGSLGGLAGADDKCQKLAADAGRSGVFRAWLSDGSKTAGERLAHGSVPYVRVDSVVVAQDWTELASGTLRAPIVKTETNGAPPGSGVAPCGSKPIWTNTLSDGGRYGGLDCYDWSNGDASATAHLGNASTIDVGWSYTCDRSCSTPTPIVCVEQ